MDSFDMFIFNLNIFQFHKGTIKTQTRNGDKNYHPYFNSIKVRLKRLKVKRQTVKTTFQFHKGTIKT